MYTDVARSFFILGLQNAHAMEKQALSIMQPQIKRLEHYPDLLQRLEAHVSETNAQIDRLETILDSVGGSSSAMKDAFLSALGSTAALGHVPAGDEVLKNSLANLAFENYEIAAYVSLIATARMAGQTEAITLLEQSLDEEQKMAQWVAEHIPSVTERFISLKASGETAKTSNLSSCRRASM